MLTVTQNIKAYLKMGSILALYSEVERRFFTVATKSEVSLRERRRLLGTDLRYCIADNYIYMPAQDPKLPSLRQLSWARIRSEIAQSFPFQFEIGIQLPEHCTIGMLQEEGVDIGDRYIKRQKEVNGRLIAVNEFCAQSLLDAISNNPEVLTNISKNQFEELCAELFTRRGFKVDLFRKTKDDGIDFLAVDDGISDPVVFAVQCKHPNKPTQGKKQHKLPVTTVREIYGVAKAFEFDGAITITSNTYSSYAKSFSNMKPKEMMIYDKRDLLEWITTYRWNEDEKP